MKGGTSLSKGWRCIDRLSEDIDIRFEPPEGLNLKGEKPAHIEARCEFYDTLAKELEIPGIAVERNRAYDDEKARNGGISLKFDSYLSGGTPENSRRRHPHGVKGSAAFLASTITKLQT